MMSYSIILLSSLCVCWATNDELRLVKYLLDTDRYETNVLPTDDPDKPVTVEIGLLLNQIIDLDERNQVLTIKVWASLIWTDVHLTWNESEYGGISSLRIMANRLWRPDITLYEDLSDGPSEAEKYFPAVVHSDGMVRWNTPAIYKSSCQLDVTYFPWDQQACLLTFGSWTYTGAKVDVTNQSSSGGVTHFQLNGEWILRGFPVRRHVITYPSGNSYPDVSFWVVMERFEAKRTVMSRKPLFYMFNLVLPAVFITATTILVFYLPAASGEKVSLGVTVLLALTVFLLMVAESTPPQSDSIPLMASYFAATIILLSLCTSITVVILNIHHRGVFDNQVPASIRAIVLDFLATIMFLRKRVNTNVSKRQMRQNHKMNVEVNSIPPDLMTTAPVEMDKPDPTDMSHTDQNIAKIFNVLESFRFERNEEKRYKQSETDWMLVAMVIDRFMLVVFVILSVAVSLAILLNHPSYGEDVDQFVDMRDKNSEHQQNI